MFKFSTLKLRNRILLGYGVPLLLSVAATTMVIGNAKKVEYQADATDRGWMLVRDSDRLERLLYKRQAMIRSYLLTQDELYFQQYEDSVNEYNEVVQSLEQSVIFSTPEQAQRLEEVKRLGKEIYAENMVLYELVKADKFNEAVQQFRQGKILSLVNQAEEVFAELNSTEDQLQEQREAEGTAAMQSLVLSAMLGTAAAIVLALTIGVWIASRITQQVNEIASTIASSSTEIAATIEQQEHTAFQQSSSVNETTSTMDQLSAAAQQSAQQAQTANLSAQQVLSLAGEGNQAVSQTLQTMLALTERVGAVSNRILQLSEQTNQISSVSGLVADLANQTNMLALNAAVEAVRAGEQGKGFAVVATEIRKLADQSKQSADRISLLVNDIQSAIQSTVVVTNESTTAASQGTQVTQQTAEVFNQVTEAINNIVVNVQQISLNTKQQAVGVQQVVAAMNTLNTAIRDTASGISQTRVSTCQLSDAAQTLKAVV